MTTETSAADISRGQRFQRFQRHQSAPALWPDVAFLIALSVHLCVVAAALSLCDEPLPVTSSLSAAVPVEGASCYCDTTCEPHMQLWVAEESKQ